MVHLSKFDSTRLPKFSEGSAYVSVREWSEIIREGGLQIIGGGSWFFVL